MVRVIRLKERRVPRFLVQKAAMRGRIRHRVFCGITEVTARGPDGDVYSEGIRFAKNTAPKFLAGTFEFSKAVPPRRGTDRDREEWKLEIEQYEREWLKLAAQLDSCIGPDLDDHIPELSEANIDGCKSWAYPIEHFTDGDSWWILGLAGTGEEILYYDGFGHSFNWHSDGWHIPGIGPPKGRQGAAPYPFHGIEVHQVLTWIVPNEDYAPIRGEIILRDRTPRPTEG